MNLATTGTLDMDVEIQYFCTLVRGKALPQFALLYADVENTETLNVDYDVKSLALYFHPVNSLKKAQCSVE